MRNLDRVDNRSGIGAKAFSLNAGTDNGAGKLLSNQARPCASSRPANVKGLISLQLSTAAAPV